jgi:hypothetical protein
VNHIRTSLSRAPSEPTSQDELRAMARDAWRRGVLVVWLEDDLADEWERQIARNWGTRLYGKV